MLRVILSSCFAALLLVVGGFTGIAKADTSASSATYVVYYPHNTFRCYSCNMIEALTKVAIEGGELKKQDGGKITVDNSKLKPMLDSNILSFRSVNVDEPENSTLLTKLQTQSKIPAVAMVVNGKIVKAHPLDKAWEYLKKDPQKYFEYVQTEIVKFQAKNK